MQRYHLEHIHHSVSETFSFQTSRNLEADTMWNHAQKAGTRGSAATTTVLDNDTGLILKQAHMNAELAAKTEGSPKCLAKGSASFTSDSHTSPQDKSF